MTKTTSPARCFTCAGTGTYRGGPYEPAQCWKCEGTGQRSILADEVVIFDHALWSVVTDVEDLPDA